MNKRGLSKLVIIAIVLLLTIMLIFIVYSTLIIFVKDKGEVATIKSNLIKEKCSIISAVESDTNPKTLEITLKKESEEGEIDLYRLVFAKNNGSSFYYDLTENLPKQYEQETFEINLSEFIEDFYEIDKIDIYAGSNTTGEIILGYILDSFEL